MVADKIPIYFPEMFQRTGHAETLLSTITNAVTTKTKNTTQDTVVQFLCEDGQVVTTDRLVS